MYQDPTTIRVSYERSNALQLYPYRRYRAPAKYIAINEGSALRQLFSRRFLSCLGKVG